VAISKVSLKKNFDVYVRSETIDTNKGEIMVADSADESTSVK
jgi:hypothetical protein